MRENFICQTPRIRCCSSWEKIAMLQHRTAMLAYRRQKRAAWMAQQRRMDAALRGLRSALQPLDGAL
jgi:hypothetical protein